MATILIIEDEPSILLGLENALLAQGYDILIARNGKLGLQHALSGQFDLIILDIMLPEMNGFEVLKQFRRQNIYTPVIILTAKGREQDKLKGFSRGADDYITKPFSIKELKARIQAILKRNQLSKPIGAHITIEGILFDFKAMRAQKDGVPVDFTTRELELLCLIK